MKQRPPEPTNLESLERLWRRAPFHDESIQDVTAVNERVVVRFRDWTLVVAGATDSKRCDLPAVRLYESIVRKAEGFRLDVETDTGRLQIEGCDVRLIRNSDMAILIPPIDV
jgi:hypothetical protein